MQTQPGCAVSGAGALCLTRAGRPHTQPESHKHRPVGLHHEHLLRVKVHTVRAPAATRCLPAPAHPDRGSTPADGRHHKVSSSRRRHLPTDISLSLSDQQQYGSNSVRLIQTHPDSPRLTQTHPDSSRLIQAHPGSSRLIQTYSDSFRLIQTHSD